MSNLIKLKGYYSLYSLNIILTSCCWFNLLYKPIKNIIVYYISLSYLTISLFILIPFMDINVHFISGIIDISESLLSISFLVRLYYTSKSLTKKLEIKYILLVSNVVIFVIFISTIYMLFYIITINNRSLIYINHIIFNITEIITYMSIFSFQYIIHRTLTNNTIQQNRKRYSILCLSCILIFQEILFLVIYKIIGSGYIVFIQTILNKTFILILTTNNRKIDNLYNGDTSSTNSKKKTTDTLSHHIINTHKPNIKYIKTNELIGSKLDIDIKLSTSAYHSISKQFPNTSDKLPNTQVSSPLKYSCTQMSPPSTHHICDRNTPDSFDIKKDITHNKSIFINKTPVICDIPYNLGGTENLSSSVTQPEILIKISYSPNIRKYPISQFNHDRIEFHTLKNIPNSTNIHNEIEYIKNENILNLNLTKSVLPTFFVVKINYKIFK